MFRKYSWLVMILIALVIIVGCKEGKKTITIATIGPMTGYSAKMGEDVMRGVKLAVDEWNAKGGVLGQQIELMIEDDRADPKDAMSVANKAASYEVVGVIGHFNSSCTIPASNIYNENNIVMITPASTNPMVTDQEHPAVFRTCGRDDQQGKVEADFATKVLKAKKIAVIHDKTTYGQGLSDEFKKNLSGKDVEVIFYEGIDINDKDFTAILTKAKTLEPDLIMFGGLYSQGGLISKQMKSLGMETSFLSGDGVYDSEYIRIAGPAAEGTYVTYSVSPEQIPAAQQFLKNFRARWPEVGPYSLFAYDATNVLIEAIKIANSTDGKTVAKAIHNNSFEGAIGHIEFDHKGDPVNSPYVIWQVQGGKWVQLEWDPRG